MQNESVCDDRCGRLRIKQRRLNGLAASNSKRPNQLALIAALTYAWSAAAAEHHVVVNAKQARFEPAYLRMAPGDTVVFQPSGRHAAVRSTLLPAGAYHWAGIAGKRYSVKLTREGLYVYGGGAHASSGMVGVVQVGRATNLAQAQALRLPQQRVRAQLQALLEQVPADQPEPGRLAAAAQQPSQPPSRAASIPAAQLAQPSAPQTPQVPNAVKASEPVLENRPPPATASRRQMQAQAPANEPASSAPTLATVRVEAQRSRASDGSYQATATRVGKVLQDPHDVPQALTTVTNKLMEEQQVGSLREALRNVPGLTFNAAEGGRAGDNMMLRSFYTFGDTYLDGIRDTAQYNRETFNLEQVDVLRGSAAMLFGRGQAGGVINQVSKVPVLADQHRLTGSLGTDGYREVTADLNKQLGETSALRINAMKRDEGSWRSNPATGDEPELHREGIAASLATGLKSSDQFVLSHVLTKTRDIPDYGFSFDAATRSPNKNFPASYFWGIDKNFDDSDTNVTTGVWTHRFSPTSELRTSLRFADYERSYWARTPSATAAPNVDGTIVNTNATTGAQTYNAGPTRAMDYETLTLQSDFNRQFKALGTTHELLAGFEFLREDSHRNGLLNLSGGNDATTNPPPFFRPYVENTTAIPVNFKSDSYALYVQDSFEILPSWKATAGARRDELDANYSSTTSPQLRYGEWSYRAALSWQPQDSSHYYLSWSDSFSPTADLYQLTVEPLPPERSQVVELGAKWLFFDGDLAFRTAIYQAEKEWERNTDLESTAAVLTKKRRTNGVEFDLAGRVTPNWEIFGGVALMDAEILEVAENVNPTTGAITASNPDYKGKRARNTPPYTVNLWTTYKLGGGWKIGGGVEAKGKRYGYNPSGAGPVPTLNGDFHPNTAPAYERYDLLLSYEQKDWGIRLNLRNVLDEIWYDALYDNGAFTVPGTRRMAILTGELKF